MEKFEVAKECSQPPVSVPYRFLTPAAAELDLRLWDRGLMRKALPILVAILERETRGWFLHFRERLIAELRAEKMPDEDIERVNFFPYYFLTYLYFYKYLQEVNEAVMKEYLHRVYNSILSHPDLQALGEGISQLLVQQARCVVLMHRYFCNTFHLHQGLVYNSFFVQSRRKCPTSIDEISGERSQQIMYLASRIVQDRSLAESAIARRSAEIQSRKSMECA